MIRRHHKISCCLALACYLLVALGTALPLLIGPLWVGGETYQPATAGKSLPTENRPIWTERKHIPPSTKVETSDVHLRFDCPVPQEQEFVLLQTVFPSALPLPYVYLRFWPRDPPAA